MTSPVRQIEVQCPRCGNVYEDSHRPSINLTLDDFDDEYLEEASTATCPQCGLKVSLGTLIVREDGVWEVEAGSE